MKSKIGIVVSSVLNYLHILLKRDVLVVAHIAYTSFLRVNMRHWIFGENQSLMLLRAER